MIETSDITHLTSIDDFAAAVAQARAHFIEMPGLTLTLPQASRLWALEATLCGEVLSTLVDARFLIRTRNAGFARA